MVDFVVGAVSLVMDVKVIIIIIVVIGWIISAMTHIIIVNITIMAHIIIVIKPIRVWVWWECWVVVGWGNGVGWKGCCGDGELDLIIIILIILIIFLTILSIWTILAKFLIIVVIILNDNSLPLTITQSLILSSGLGC